MYVLSSSPLINKYTLKKLEFYNKKVLIYYGIKISHLNRN